MSLLIYSFITSFLVAFFTIPLVIKFFTKKKIFDIPGGRKIHKNFTPSMGGIGIFGGLMLSSVFWMTSGELAVFKYVFGGLVIVFITGMRDDLIPLRPSYKLIAQIVAASMVVGLSDIRLNSLHGLFGVYEIPFWLGTSLSVFTIIVITNSFNLIDGVDGLAGTISVIVLSSFGIWFYLLGNYPISIMIFGMIGAIVAFLNFNWEPSRIFMGDTGALVIGYFMSILAIYFIEQNDSLSQGHAYKFTPTISTAVAVLIIPLFDTLRVFISRAIRGKSPFSPDMTHLHHLLLRLGLSHSGAVMVLGGANLLFIVMAIAMSSLSDVIALPVIVGTALLLSLFLEGLARRQDKKRQNALSRPA
ncbi:glycosyltransferase family 4 protein [Roseivirga sp. BDSF3-8]|uniref:glycosyltransferase family 4 protein n=1 Tax=Roseivirga sp. BDSF3-8 TaxID=3241598 RepID=UPI0035320045